MNYSIIYYKYWIFWYIKSRNKGSYKSQNPEIVKIEVWRFSQYKIEKLLVQNEAEWFPGAFKPIFSINWQQKWLQQCPKQIKFEFQFEFRPPQIHLVEFGNSWKVTDT